MRISQVRGSRRVVLVAATLGLVSACGKSAPAQSVGPGLPSSDDSSGGLGLAPSSSGSAPATSPTTGKATAPTQSFALGVRQLDLSRGADRPLRTLVWYPTVGTAGGGAKLNAAPTSGRYPLVLFSHGLHGTPEGSQVVAARIAAAGFVVAAPAFPYTNGNTKSFTSNDMPNQPADASFVISEVLKLDLAAHIDASKIGAAGHSAGGYTTAGMLSGKTRDTRLKAGIVIAGGQMNGNFTGPATPVLFVHGDKDPTVAYATGRAAYDKVPWSKAFLTVIGGDHGTYLFGASMGGGAPMKTMLDFLRWTLYGDEVAQGRLRPDGTIAGAAKFESTF